MWLKINLPTESWHGEDFTAKSFKASVDPLACVLWRPCAMDSSDSLLSATPANLLVANRVKTWNTQENDSRLHLNSRSTFKETYTRYFSTNNLFHQSVNDHNIIINYAKSLTNSVQLFEHQQTHVFNARNETG